MFDFDVVTGPAQPPKPVTPREDATAKAAPLSPVREVKSPEKPN